MTRKRTTSVLIALLLTTAGIARADKIDDFVTPEMGKRHVPGVSIAVVKDGKVVLARGYGLANVELSVPASADTVYELASVTKQFTATGVMMLVEEGKISLDDRIDKHLDNLPAAWSGVTVRHLLTHTSGIKSYTSIPEVTKSWRNDISQAEMLKLVAGYPLDFPPGDKWSYDNTGYYLLGMLIEKVSGQKYGDFLKQRIFEPIGMASTRLNDAAAIIKNRACGYSWTGKEFRNAEFVSPTQPFAAGALVSTVNDMAKWDIALNGDKLLKRSSLKQMWTPVKLNDGKTAPYGFGWSIGDRSGHKVIGHGGGIPGFSTQISRFVDDRLSVIVLANCDGGSADALANGIAGLYVPALTPVAEKPIEDKDPATTARHRALLASVLDGKYDASVFSPEMAKTLEGDGAKQVADMIKPLGPLKSFQLMATREDGGQKMYRCRVVFGSMPFLCMVAVRPDGKIGGLGIRPE